ncbi:MAG: S-adenosylmethionine:tRNA ribosyltransferase-isomerase, partial [Balneolaceae bacterium]
MKLTDFRFEIDDHKVPEKPNKKRDTAKLMVLDRKTRSIEHQTFSDLPQYMNAGDLIIYNNTK